MLRCAQHDKLGLVDGSSRPIPILGVLGVRLAPWRFRLCANEVEDEPIELGRALEGGPVAAAVEDVEAGALAQPAPGAVGVADGDETVLAAPDDHHGGTDAAQGAEVAAPALDAEHADVRAQGAKH